MDILFSPKNTLQGTNISPTKALVKIIVLFPRWDMLVSQRVIWNHQNGRYLGITFDFERLDASQRLLLGKDVLQFQPYWEKPGQVGGQNFATNPTKTNTPQTKTIRNMHAHDPWKEHFGYFWILEKIDALFQLQLLNFQADSLMVLGPGAWNSLGTLKCYDSSTGMKLQVSWSEPPPNWIASLLSANTGLMRFENILKKTIRHLQRPKGT